MATFADLSTLLMTFFVLLLSMANMDIQSFKEMLGSIREAFGVRLDIQGQYEPTIPEQVEIKLDPGEGEWQDKSADLLAGDTESEMDKEFDEATDLEKAEEELKKKEKEELDQAVDDIKAAIEQTQMGDNVEVMAGPNGIRIRVKGALMFGPGSADLKPEARPFLDNLTLVLQKFPYNLLVEGHTDSSPISTARFPSNWELSGDRASAVLRYLITWGVDPLRMTSIGLADNYPLAPNDSPENMAKNRRVEFVLTKKSFRPEIE